MKVSHHQEALRREDKITKTTPSKPKRNQFLNSLYNSLENPHYHDGMCWDTDGRAFIIKNPTFIAERILKEEFNGMKFTSFIRQLSYYGFQRVSRRTNMKVYSHEKFQKERKDVLKQIKRNQKNIEAPKPLLSPIDIMSVMEQKINTLEAENEKIRAENLTFRIYFKSLRKKLFKENSVSTVEAISRQNPSLNGFSQTYFSPPINNYCPLSNTISENPGSVRSANFIEVNQPDYRVYQDKPTEDRVVETPNSHPSDSSVYEEEDEIGLLLGHADEESIWDEMWGNEEPLDFEF